VSCDTAKWHHGPYSGVTGMSDGVGRRKRLAGTGDATRNVGSDSIVDPDERQRLYTSLRVMLRIVYAAGAARGAESARAAASERR
jgi:hypothetical protein